MEYGLGVTVLSLSGKEQVKGEGKEDSQHMIVCGKAYLIHKRNQFWVIAGLSYTTSRKEYIVFSTTYSGKVDHNNNLCSIEGLSPRLSVDRSRQGAI